MISRDRVQDALAKEGLNLTLSPLDIRCAWPVFKGVDRKGNASFVKVADPASAAKTLAFLTAVADTPLFPRVLLPRGVELDGRLVICLEWKASRTVAAEEMTEAQFDSFCDGCFRLSRAMQNYRGALRPLGDESPDAEYAVLSDYASRHPIVARFLGNLLVLPACERSYAGRTLSVIHADFQPRNYGFSGDALSAVYDFDALTTGLPCEDAAYAFTERARRLELSACARRRLADFFRRLIERSPWPRDEWVVAVNHARLRIASRRVASHPKSFYTAIDIARRDRPLCRFMRETGLSHA